MKLISPAPPPSATAIEEFLHAIYPTLISLGSQPSCISEVCPVDEPSAGSTSLSFIRSADLHQLQKTLLRSTSGSFLINEKAPDFTPPKDKWIIRVPDPNGAYVSVMENFFLDQEESFLPQSIHPTAIIDSSAKIAGNVAVGAYVTIGAHCVIENGVVIHPHTVLYHNVTLGERCILHAHTIIREHSVIGAGCVIQPGAVIGGDGFGYIPDPKIGLRTVPQTGIVELAKNVDVGSNACIDRAAFGATKIGVGSKVDNLVQIGHNVQIGINSVICGQVGIGGSSKVGDGVVLGGQVGVGDHMNIASGVRVGGAGVVISHVDEPGDYMGYPVQPAFKWRRVLASQNSLPDFMKSQRKKKSED